MAKPHKFAWNGVDIETALGFEQVANMAQRAAQESTGDLMHGKHRIASVKSTERQIEFRISDYLISFKKLMVFHLDFETRGGRTWMSSRIDWYVTTQPTVSGFIPVGFKAMVGHFTYLQFVRNLAEQVRAADPGARITLREGASGVPPTEPARPAGTSVPNPDPAQPKAVGAVTPPPPPPPTGGAFGPPPRPPGGNPLARPVPSLPPPPASGVQNEDSSPRAGSSGLVTSVPGVRHDPWSAPVASAPEPARSRFAAVEPALTTEDHAFHTRHVQSPSRLPAQWELTLSSGQTVPLIGLIVLGRDPIPPPGVEARATSINDPRRSISKTHAMIELRDGTPWVTDLRSTNGTRVIDGRGVSVICEPGIGQVVDDGSTLMLGEFRAGVRRAIRESVG